ncbi:hypothetical protein SH661x_002701 [Planctomicrobium sp. SH661]|uniref:hypothetical protein n=1 Tax=Planctomicrobium sp. SH661 TaxID=3448124 RepID=UPI003F5B3295
MTSISRTLFNKRISRSRVVATVALLSMAAGCGSWQGTPNSVSVAGNVTLDRTPLPMGTITFIPVDGKTSTAGAVIKNGTYSLKMTKGDFRVEISAPEVVGKTKLYDTPDSPVREIVQEALPETYNKNSELRKVIDSNNPHVDFELSGKKG